MNMDVKMAVFVMCVAVVIFLISFYLLSAVGMGLLYAWGAGLRWLMSQSLPWRTPDPEWCRISVVLAFLGAAWLTVYMWLYTPTDVSHNPWIKGVRIEFRQLSAWHDTVDMDRCSDCFTHVTVTYVAADGRRTSEEVTESNRDYCSSPEEEPVRTILWATNSSGRAVVTVDSGESLFFPDRLPLPRPVPDAAIRAYLQGHSTNVVLQLLQTTSRMERVP
jgi:hypothetical protein